MLRAPTRIPPPRATDADREAALDRLSAAAADGRLGFDELEQRAERAGRATTRAELARVTSDLGPPRAPRERHRSVLSTDRRSGRWAVAPSSRFATVLGTVVLDLRRAEFASAEVDVEIAPVFGTVRVEVPPGVEVEVHAGGVLTGCRVRLDAPAAAPGSPVVRIHVRGFCGSAVVRSRARLSDHVRDHVRHWLERHGVEPAP